MTENQKALSAVANEILEAYDKVEPLYNLIEAKLAKLYPTMPKKQVGDWAMEFVNNRDHEAVFTRLNTLFPQ